MQLAHPVAQAHFRVKGAVWQQDRDQVSVQLAGLAHKVAPLRQQILHEWRGTALRCQVQCVLLVVAAAAVKSLLVSIR